MIRIRPKFDFGLFSFVKKTNKTIFYKNKKNILNLHRFFSNLTFFGCLQKIKFSFNDYLRTYHQVSNNNTYIFFHLDIHWLGNWHFGSDGGTSGGDHRGNDATKQAKDL